MNLRHLRQFMILAEELHFRKAAERLDMTQGPLSLAIQALEEDLGTRLFDRTRRSVQLTAAGQALLEDVPGILERIESTRNHVRRVVTGESGRLELGFTSASSLLPFFPQAINAYRVSSPKVAVTLKELPSNLQIQSLLANQLDAGLLRSRTADKVSELVFKHLLDEPLVVAMSEGHRLAHHPDVSIEELRHEPFIAYPSDSGVVLSETIMILCAKRSFTPGVVQEAREPSTIIGLTAAGLGIAIIPACLRAINVPGVVFRSLRDSDAVSSLYFVYRYGCAAPTVHRFVTQLQAQIQQYIL